MQEPRLMPITSSLAINGYDPRATEAADVAACLRAEQEYQEIIHAAHVLTAQVTAEVTAEVAADLLTAQVTAEVTAEVAADLLTALVAEEVTAQVTGQLLLARFKKKWLCERLEREGEERDTVIRRLSAATAALAVASVLQRAATWRTRPQRSAEAQQRRQVKAKQRKRQRLSTDTHLEDAPPTASIISDATSREQELRAALLAAQSALRDRTQVLQLTRKQLRRETKTSKARWQKLARADSKTAKNLSRKLSAKQARSVAGAARREQERVRKRTQPTGDALHSSERKHQRLLGKGSSTHSNRGEGQGRGGVKGFKGSGGKGGGGKGSSGGKGLIGGKGGGGKGGGIKGGGGKGSGGKSGGKGQTPWRQEHVWHRHS